VELLLVTVIIGLLATIAAPHLVQARESVYLAQVEADMRALASEVEKYAARKEGGLPGSMQDLKAGSAFNPSQEVEYCLFEAIPGSDGRDAHLIVVAGHPASTRKVLLLFPLWGSETLDFDNGRRGC
jgi:Tfp pilus assembly protein PilE